MNALAILSLISDLYIQIENLQNKIDLLEEDVNNKDRK
jgi:hypothetical protein